MGSVSSEDGSDELCGSYSLSADVSESESSNSFSCRRLDAGGSSSSITSSSLGNGNFTFPVMVQQPLLTFPVVRGKGFVVWEEKPEKREVDLSEYAMMKERFAKLLLGEDMSGGVQGVCSALAISNAITNLSATVFGELWRLEPLASQKKAMWCREMEWLLCVSDSIVEFVPSKQQFLGGGKYEVMETRPRSDLYMNLPALKKIDAMLISMLDGFQETEFWYVDGGIIVPDAEMYPSATSFCGRPSVRQEEKWWLPCPKVPPKGLSEDARKRLQQWRDCTNQILKASMAINSSVLAEMEIPNAYLETLPKTEKACLGDDIYHYITAEQFFPERILGCLDLSSEYRVLDVANRIEAAIHVGKQNDQRKPKKHPKAKHSLWGGKVKCLVAHGDKKMILAQRAVTLLHSLRLRFPSLPQTALDMSKIQYNKDVGQSILESYSRVMESLAFNVMARIDDVLYVDDSTKQCVTAESQSLFSRGGLDGLPIQKRMTRSPFSIQHTPYTSPLATPTFCFSPPQCQSPGKTLQHSDKNGLKGHSSKKFHIPVPADLDKLWSYTGNLSSGNAPERD